MGRLRYVHNGKVGQGMRNGEIEQSPGVGWGGGVRGEDMLNGVGGPRE